MVFQAAVQKISCINLFSKYSLQLKKCIGENK